MVWQTMVFMVFHHHCMFCTMVLYHYPAGCEHPLVKVREHVWLQICEQLVIMPFDIYPGCGIAHSHNCKYKIRTGAGLGTKKDIPDTSAISSKTNEP
jgi:hypothetical protein